jgi:hypothetical protein
MIHTYKTGKNFEIGILYDPYDGTHDISVITKWDEENEYEQGPVIVNYYFGDYDKKDTDFFIEQYYKKQELLKRILKHLNFKVELDGYYLEQEKLEELQQLKDDIKSVEEMITDWF